MKKFDFQNALAIGRNMEETVKLSLQRKGWLIIPTADITRADGKGPRAEGKGEMIVLPDFDVVTPEKRFWAEVKYKQAANYTILTHREEHGIGLVPWRHYWAIQERTKSEVWLFVVEGKTGLLLSQSLTQLQHGARLYTGPKMDPGGMVFFDRAAFVQSSDIPALPSAPEGQPRLQYQLWK